MSLCKTCSGPLGTQNKSGYCKRHISAALAANPAWREKQRNGARMSLHSNPVRLEKLRATAVIIGKLPQSVEARRKHCIERRLWERGQAAQPKGSQARIDAGKRQSATKLPWCPPHLRDDYHRLVNRHKFKAAEARAMIEEQYALEMARFRRSIGAEENADDRLRVAICQEELTRPPVTLAQKPKPTGPREIVDRMIDLAQTLFGLDEGEILSLNQSNHIMPARYAIAMALHRNGVSYPRVAHSLNRDDHSTAMNWVKRGDYLEGRDRSFAQAVRVISSAWPADRLEAA